MNTRSELLAKRELLLLELHVQRQVLADFGGQLPCNRSFDVRSVTMRFILSRPHLCLWALGEIIPFVISRFPGSSGKRFARALQADQEL